MLPYAMLCYAVLFYAMFCRCVSPPLREVEIQFKMRGHVLQVPQAFSGIIGIAYADKPDIAEGKNDNSKQMKT